MMDLKNETATVPLDQRTFIRGLAALAALLQPLKPDFAENREAYELLIAQAVSASAASEPAPLPPS